MKRSRFDSFCRQYIADNQITDFRGDAVATQVFFTRQLEDIDAVVNETKYAQLKALQMVQLLPGLDPLAERYTRRKVDWSGVKSKRSASPTDTAPLAQTSRGEESMDYQIYKQGFGYSRDEVAKSAKYGMALDRERAESARKLQAQSLDALIATGDAEVGMPGLLTLSGTDTYTIPTDGAGSSALWANKTPDQILRDLNGIVTRMLTTTKDVFGVKRIVLPTTLRRTIQTTGRSTVSDRSIEEYFKLQNPGIEILEWERLSDSSADLYGNSCNGTSISSGLNRILAGDFSVENVRALVPLMNEMLEPERQGEGFKVDLKMKVGGVDVPQPKAIIYADGA
jgi:hypothetical protein